MTPIAVVVICNLHILNDAAKEEKVVYGVNVEIEFPCWLCALDAFLI